MRTNLTKKDLVNSIYMQVGFSKQIAEYLKKIKTETLLAYGVYQIEADGLQLFESIKGDQNSIMGLPIKHIINYINQYK